jgi:hypothetical protein
VRHQFNILLWQEAVVAVVRAQMILALAVAVLEDFLPLLVYPLVQVLLILLPLEQVAMVE